MTRACSHLLFWLLVFHCFTPLLAQHETPWLSLNRLSLSFQSSYHFRPWDLYNHSLGLVQDALRYDPAYKNPEGSLQKITGDGSLEFSASYRLVAGLAFESFGGYTMTGSSSSITDVRTPTSKTQTTQDLSLLISEYGVGARYFYDVGSGIALSAFARLSRAEGKITYQYVFDPPWSTIHLFDATLRAASTTARIGLGAEMILVDHVKVTLAVEYRWLKFIEFRGPAKETYRDVQSSFEAEWAFHGRLVEIRGSFFGLDAVESPHPPNSHLLHTLWNRTELYPFWWGNTRPAAWDLSSVGAKFGVVYEF